MTNNYVYKKFLVLLLSLLILCGCSSLSNKECQEYLTDELDHDAFLLAKYGEDGGSNFLYKNQSLNLNKIKYPAYYNQFEQGIVTPVKNQDSLGTCWIFSTISACETSLLTKLGLTVDKYLELYGKDLDLSEKHLAYFANTSKDNDGYNYYDQTEYNIYFSGGNSFIVSNALSNLTGIVNEELFPYYVNGVVDFTDKWTLNEKDRYLSTYNLVSSNHLESPNIRDEEGNTTFNESGITSIKDELYKGHGVTICYHADTTQPNRTYEQFKEYLKEDLDKQNITEELREKYLRYRAKDIDINDLTLDELKELISLRLNLNELPQTTYDIENLDKELAVLILNSLYFGHDLELIYSYEEYYKNFVNYINVDKNNPTYAHYTYDEVAPNHMVTVVGWDDNYSTSNFIEGHKPEADGAFICKNSWGSNYGNNGLFYLSYYDKSISEPTSFIIEENADYEVKSYDNAAYETINSTLFDNKVYQANIFEFDKDTTIDSLSCITADLNTTVKFEVFEIEEGKEINKGKKLSAIKEKYQYGGFHKIDLDKKIDVAANTKIAVVITQKVKTMGKAKYALVNTSALSKECVDDYISGDRENIWSSVTYRYSKPILNYQESFISFDNKTWFDWKDVVTNIKSTSANSVLVEYDNLPIKIYTKD